MIREAALLGCAIPWLFVAGGCRCEGEGAPPLPTEPSASSSAEEDPSERPRLPEVLPPAPSGPVATVVRVVDDPDVEGSASVSASQRLAAGDVIDAGGATVVVDFEDGGRVELYPGSRALIGGEAPAQLFLGSGSARVAQAPAGNSARPPLRVGTPAGTVEVAGAGDAVVALLPDGSSWMATLGGSASAARGEMDEDQLPLEAEVGAGGALRIGDGPLEDVASPEGLEAVRAHASELSSAALAREADDWAAEVAVRRAALDATIETITALLGEGSAIRAARARPDPNNPNWRRETLIRAIQYSLRLRRDRRLALTRYERWRAACLAARMDSDPAVATRVHALMALPETM